MSKTNGQKAARQRRRTRQRQLVEAGRQAEDLVSQHRQQAAEAAGRVQRLEEENAKLRHDQGEATSLLAESNKALNSNITILEGLRTELDVAAQQVRMAEAERDAMSAICRRPGGSWRSPGRPTSTRNLCASASSTSPWRLKI